MRDWEDSSVNKDLSHKHGDLRSNPGTYEKARCGFLVTPSIEEAKINPGGSVASQSSPIVVTQVSVRKPV